MIDKYNNLYCGALSYSHNDKESFSFVWQIATLVGVAALLKLSTATPDSAGIVEMVNGLAYGKRERLFNLNKIKKYIVTFLRRFEFGWEFFVICAWNSFLKK